MNTSRIVSAALAASLALSARAADYYVVPSPNSYEAFGTSSISGSGNSTGWSDTQGGSKTIAGITAADSVYHVWANTLCRSATGSYATPASSSIEVEEDVSLSILGKQSGNTTTLNNVLLKRGSTLHYTNNGDGGVGTLAGSFTVVDGAALEVSGRYFSNANRGMRLSASVSGTGSLVFYRNDGDNSYLPNQVTHTVSGDLSLFAGDLVVYDYQNLTTLVLELASAQSMPGNPASDATAKVVVTNGATLKISEDWTSPVNRSWDFGAGSRPTVYVASGKTVTINGMVSGSVGFTKTGPGTLILAGWMTGFAESDIVISEGSVVICLADGADDELRVMSAGEEFGFPSPAYGVTNGLAAGASIAVSAPAWTNAAGTIAATCTGWRLRNETGDVISSGFGNAFTYVHPDPAAYRILEWLWTREFRAAAVAAAGEGTATVSEPWVAPGGTTTFTATPAAGFAFSCWMDGSGIVSCDNPCTLTVNAPTTLRAVFADSSSAGWLYDGSGSTKLLTELDPPDGGPAWIIKCTVSGANLTLTGVQQVGTNAVLNLRLPVADANGTPYLIVSVGVEAFNAKNTITDLVLPDTVTKIDSRAFNKCAYLHTVRLPANLKTIGDASFAECVRLTNVTPFLPDTVTLVYPSVFYNCYRLASPLRVGCGVDGEGNPVATTINLQAFRLTKIPSAYIGDGVTSLPANCFQSSTSLQSVRLPPCLTSIGSDCFAGCSALEDALPLPATLTNLGTSAFNGTKVSGEVYLGTNGVPIAINSFGFYNTKITKLVLGPGVSGTVPNYFCAGCTALASAEVTDNITALGSQSFQSCSSLTSFRLPTDLTSLGNDCFSGCSSLEDVSPLLPTGCTYVGSSAFSGTRITGDVYFATNGVAASFGGNFNFKNTRITSVTMGDGITSIPANAFQSCTLLESVRLPAYLTSIGSDCFSGCSVLETVTPLLPATLTSLGSSAFNSTRLTGDVYFATNGAAASFGGNYNFYKTRITSMTMGDGITSIPAYAFQSCTLLQSVRLPANLTSIGSDCFSGCSSLETVEPLLPAPLTSLGSSAFNGTKISGDLYFATNNASASFGGNCNFYKTKLTTATFGSGVSKLTSYLFGEVTTLRRLVLANKPTFDGNALVSVPNYQVAVVVPPDNADWTAFVNNASSATPWESVTDAQRQAYLANFPGEPYPRALSKSAPANQWIVSYGLTPAGQRDLVVAANPGSFAAAEVVPAYGSYTNLAATLGLPLALTAPRYAHETDTLYECAGYRIEGCDNAGWTGAVDYELDDPTAPAVSYDPAADGQKRFSWLWNPVAWQVVVQQPENASVGAVTVTGADLEGYFTSGTTATVTAVPGAGASFVRWYGDVPEGHEIDATLTFVVDGPKNLTPEFASSWVLINNDKAVTDGYWTINVSGNRNDGFTVGSPTVVPSLGILDLRKPIEGGGFFKAIANSAFDSKKTLKIVRLPDTLVSTGYRSFYNCTSLTTVEPLMPPNFKTMGDQCFYSCSALTGDLYFATNGIAASFSGGTTFNGTKITSVTLGDGITAIPGACFQNCKSLRSVKTGEGITSIGGFAFQNCSALETFEPLLPAACTSIGDQCFYLCSALTGDLYFATNGIAASFSGGTTFNGTKITSVTLGDGITAIPGACFQNCKSLRTVKIGEGITSFGGFAFNSCSVLETIEPFLPAACKSIGDQCFYSCPALTGDLFLGTNGVAVSFSGGTTFNGSKITSVTLGDGVTTLPGACFQNCKSLGDVHVSDALASIGGYAFESCTAMTNFTPLLPASIATIGDRAFQNCTSLVRTLEVGGNRKTVTFSGSWNFYNTAITNAVFGAGVAALPGNSFQSSKLKSATFVNFAGAVNGSAFESTSSIRDLYFIGDAIPTFNSTAFKNWSAGQARLHLPSDSATWRAWAGANATEWWDLTDDIRDSYFDRWPGERKKPYGRMNANAVPANQWVLGWIPPGRGTMVILR